MKTLLLSIIVVISLTAVDAVACNVCGCGVANYHYGILPQYTKNFIGVRYRHRSYQSTLEAGHDAPFSNETFQSAELWGRFYPFKKLQAFVFLPYNFNERIEGQKITRLTGIGDAVISANYNLFNTYDSVHARIKHSLLIGGGVKLPTGKFQAIEDGLTVNQNFQLGTGSIDFLFNLIYTIRMNKVGFNGEFTYNVNTTNKDDYRFGNTSRSGVSTFYVASTGKLTVMPNAGVSVETFADNKQYGQAFPETGGWAMLYNAGIESYYNQIAFGITYTHPGKQQLFSGNVTSYDRIAMHVTFMF
jgi:hypothetical protein